MPDINEAPIIHGSISVNNMTSHIIQFSNGSYFNGIDNTLNQTSTNPLMNSTLTNAINNIIVPPPEKFVVHLVMNPSASHNAGHIVFPTINTLVNDFSQGGTDEFNSVITVPVSGTYNIFFNTTAYNTLDDLSIHLVIDGQSLTPVSGSGVVTYSNTVTLSNSSQVTLYSNTTSPARSELFVCLVKKDQTLTN